MSGYDFRYPITLVGGAQGRSAVARENNGNTAPGESRSSRKHLFHGDHISFRIVEQVVTLTKYAGIASVAVSIALPRVAFSLGSIRTDHDGVGCGLPGEAKCSPRDREKTYSSLRVCQSSDTVQARTLCCNHSSEQ